MTRRPLEVHSALPRPEQQRYAVCAAPGCNRTPRSFSRYCSMHARTFHRTRDPNGRAIRIGEIRPYLQLATLYLERNAHHPAVVAAEEFLRVNLEDPTMPRDIRRQLHRLQIDGATPRGMLVTYLAVWGLRHYMPHTVTGDACEAFNIGNRVLRTCPVPTVTSATGKRTPVRIPARVCEAYGVLLRQTLGVFGTQFWQHVQSELDASSKAARAVSLALRASPFSINHPRP